MSATGTATVYVIRRQGCSRPVSPGAKISIKEALERYLFYFLSYHYYFCAQSCAHKKCPERVNT